MPKQPERRFVKHFEDKTQLITNGICRQNSSCAAFRISSEEMAELMIFDRLAAGKMHLRVANTLHVDVRRYREFRAPVSWRAGWPARKAEIQPHAQ